MLSRCRAFASSRWLGIVVLGVFLMLCPHVMRASEPATGIYPSANERFGFGVTGDISHYDVSPLHAGWFVNWGIMDNLAHTQGLEFAQIIRVGAQIRPSFDQLRHIARANPGSLWLVGNEPDCIWQDNVLPETYAQQYHDIYTILKEADPTCQVAIGGVVQATPLRLQWLDRVWNSYLQRYGQTMPVDVWNVHNFILQEKRGSWGCEIPPGIDATQGMLYKIWEHDNMDYFRQQIVAFRRWMAEKGQRNKPLIVSEYGILFHEGLGYDYQRVKTFMLATFDYFLHATDPQLGYPADGNRLVQRWAWYSLDDPSFEQDEFTTWSALYNPFPPYEIRQLGRDFGAYTAPLVTPYVDLLPARLSIEAPGELTYGKPATITLGVRVQNRGNIASGELVPVQFWDGLPESGGRLIGSVSVSSVPARRAGERLAQLAWRTVITSPKTVHVRVNPAGELPESDLTNNALTQSVQHWANLRVRELGLEPRIPLVQSGEPATVTLHAVVSNVGTLRVENVEACFYGRKTGSSETFLGCVTADSLNRGGLAALSLEWSHLEAGSYVARVVVDPSDRIVEAQESDNAGSITFLVARFRQYGALFQSPGVPMTHFPAYCPVIGRAGAMP